MLTWGSRSSVRTTSGGHGEVEPIGLGGRLLGGGRGDGRWWS